MQVYIAIYDIAVLNSMIYHVIVIYMYVKM